MTNRTEDSDLDINFAYDMFKILYTVIALLGLNIAQCDIDSRLCKALIIKTNCRKCTKPETYSCQP